MYFSKVISRKGKIRLSSKLLQFTFPYVEDEIMICILSAFKDLSKVSLFDDGIENIKKCDVFNYYKISWSNNIEQLERLWQYPPYAEIITNPGDFVPLNFEFPYFGYKATTIKGGFISEGILTLVFSSKQFEKSLFSRFQQKVKQGIQVRLRS